MFGLILKTVVVLIGCLVVADIVGVFFCTVFEISPFRGNSVALPYVIWFVLGVFCGLSALAIAGAWHSPDTAGDWFSGPEALPLTTKIVCINAAVLAGLSLFFYRIYWSQGVLGEYYVPDSAPHSITFFVAVLGVMVLFRYLMGLPEKTPEPAERTTPVKPERRSKNVP